ncbi:hypothetical protein, partial [Pseudomonas aeruginosa]|uniref:hypothetical protein n=1 Tax=Pseudomonas aeruginosa TaxID=287 RepID=UPI001BAF18A3
APLQLDQAASIQRRVTTCSGRRKTQPTVRDGLTTTFIVLPEREKFLANLVKLIPQFGPALVFFHTEFANFHVTDSVAHGIFIKDVNYVLGVEGKPVVPVIRPKISLISSY